jgi:hypothetical protein
MYDLTLGQNGHFSKKIHPKKTMYLSYPMPLINVDIFLIVANTLIKLHLLKNHNLL